MELSGMSGGKALRFVKLEESRRIRKERGLEPPDEARRLEDGALERARFSGQQHWIEEATERALKESRERERQAREQLAALEAGASVAPDGRRIYRTADGRRAFFEDGSEAAQEQMDAVVWRPGRADLGGVSAGAGRGGRRNAGG